MCIHTHTCSAHSIVSIFVHIFSSYSKLITNITPNLWLIKAWISLFCLPVICCIGQQKVFRWNIYIYIHDQFFWHIIKIDDWIDIGAAKFSQWNVFLSDYFHMYISMHGLFSNLGNTDFQSFWEIEMSRNVWTDCICDLLCKRAFVIEGFSSALVL